MALSFSEKRLLGVERKIIKEIRTNNGFSEHIPRFHTQVGEGRFPVHIQVRGAYSLTWAHRENTGGRLLQGLRRLHLDDTDGEILGYLSLFLTWSCSLRQAKILSLPGIWIIGNPSLIDLEYRDSNFWRKCPFHSWVFPSFCLSTVIVFLQRIGTAAANEISALLNISHALGILQRRLFIVRWRFKEDLHNETAWFFWGGVYNSGVKGQRGKKNAKKYQRHNSKSNSTCRGHGRRVIVWQLSAWDHSARANLEKDTVNFASMWVV